MSPLQLNEWVGTRPVERRRNLQTLKGHVPRLRGERGFDKCGCLLAATEREQNAVGESGGGSRIW